MAYVDAGGRRPVEERIGVDIHTGDILDDRRDKFSLKYYVKLARELEKMGAHFLAIKDMAGLCKPDAAFELVKTLRQEVGVPIHFHTHDTSGISSAAVLKAADAGVHVADAAVAAVSGGTSQPNLNSIVEALRLHAAAHEGQLPARLADIGVPMPVDPVTGKPFDYDAEGATAHLRGPAPGGATPGADVHYAVTLLK